MKHQFAIRKWKRFLSAGLSLAMAVSLLPSIPARAELSESAKTTPTPDKACSIPLPADGSTNTGNQPFPRGAAGSEVFRIPAMITMETGELLAIADARYKQPTDGNGLDTMASISGDGGETWEYCFPFFFPDSYQDAHRQSTAFIDPGLLEGPDGTIYCIADVFPTEYSIQNIGARSGSGYVDIDGTKRLALTDNYSNVSTAPVDENDEKYLYYVGEFCDGYARILKREDNLPTEYAVDEWYNLYTVDENGVCHDDLKQKQINLINDDEREIQQNVYYKDSMFHVYQTGYLWVITSKDHGRTWEHPTDIIPQVKTDDDQLLLISPGCGLTANDGTLVIGLYRFNGSEDPQQASLMYSSDNGETWQRTENITTGGWSSENEIVELEDGTLRMFYRGGGGGKISYADFTKNPGGGYDVGECVNVDGCSVDSNCNMGAISYSKKINGKQAILFSCPGGPGRSHGKIFTFLVNDDEGKTLSLHHTYDVPKSESNFVYSTLTELQDGSIGFLWEEGDQNANIWFNKIDIADLVAANASIENPDGSKYAAASANIAKGETFTKTYAAPEDMESGKNFITTPPNENVATATVETKTELSVQMPVYAHLKNANSVSEAFGTNVAPSDTLELTDAEFTFKKSGDKWHIKNEATNQYLQIVEGNSGPNAYFGASAKDIMVDESASGSGIFRLHRIYDKSSLPTEQNIDGYAIFHEPYKSFNIGSGSGNATSSNFIFWEQSQNPSDDSKVPGYRQASNPVDGGKYLITVKSGGSIILLWPENGTSNQTKLLAVKPSAASVKAYAHATNSSSLATAFATETAQPASIELADAEFLFTKTGEGSYQIKNQATNQYMTMYGSAATDYFESTVRDVVVTPQNNGTVFINCPKTADNKVGYALFYTTQCNWNRASGTSDSSYICGLTLWERSESASEDSKIPGYQEAAIEDADSMDGKSYLITAKYNNRIILLYPQNGASNQPKLIVTKPGKTAVKAYAHVSNNSDLAAAFATETAQPEIIELADAEFLFAKTGEGNYQIKNQATNQYMTMYGSAATDYFESTARDVVVTPQSDGTVFINCPSTADNKVGYALFYTTQCNWNRADTTSNSNFICGLTLWERSESAPEDSKIPGYQEAAIEDANSMDGKSYLITAKYNDRVILLYPQNGASNQPKLIEGPLDPSDDDAPSIVIPDPVIGRKTNILVSITGVNSGFTKAVIDGMEYRIHVTDDTALYPTGEPIDIPYISSYQVSEADAAIADAADAPDAKLALYDYASPKAGSITTFSKTANKDLDIADAEFTFTQDAENEGKWIIQSGDKYLVQIESGHKLFSNEPRPMTVPQTDDAGTFHIYNHAEGENGRYVMLVSSAMSFNATGGLENKADYRYELTFWKKDASATESPLPGYRKVTAGEGIENNGVYLITYVLQENETEYAILLYPKDEDSIDNSSALTKLARMDTMVRILPKTSGQFHITIDGREYTWNFVDPSCQHQEDKHPIKGYAEAECEAAGYTGDSVCSLCGSVITKGTVVPAKKHTWNSVRIQELTDAKNGIYLQTCKNNPMHQKKTFVYASAYGQLKEMFQNAPEEISDNKKALYKEADVTALKAAYEAGTAVAKKPAAEQTNKEMYGSMEDLKTAGKQLHSHRDGLETDLAQTLAKALPIKTAGKQESNSQAAWDAFSNAFTNADKPETIQKNYAELETIVTSLKTALFALNQESAKAGLTALYNQHKDKEKGDYSDSTWPIFTKALQDAKEILDKASASVSEIVHAQQALEKALEELRTNADETAASPESIVYTPPIADQYPKAAVVSAGDNNSSHTKQVSDWMEESSALTENNPDVKTVITNKDGIWGFNGQLKSDSAKYNVSGENHTMAISMKLWLNKIETSQQVEILAKGEQYSLQLKQTASGSPALTLWMRNGSDAAYPTVTYPLNNGDHVGKWLDVVLIISGNNYQSIYVNGDCSEENSNKPVLSSASEPFTIGYRAGGDGIPFTSEYGYLADIKFYDCQTEDISEGQTRDYGAIANLLHAKTPAAMISADAYDTKTTWSAIAGDQSETAMEPMAKFEADTIYKASATFTAHDYFHFSDTEEFCAAVADTVDADRSNAVVNVSVAENQKTMTVEVTYPLQSPLDIAKDAVMHALKAAKSTYDKGQGSYSDETWSAFKTAYENALNAPENADADTLNELAKELSDAQKALTRSTEKAKEVLNAAIAAADAMYQEGEEIYTTESFEPFRAAYEAAKNAPANATADELQKLADDLDAARQTLSLDNSKVLSNATVSATAAENKIKNIGQGTYTTKSWSAFTEAYNALKAELEKGDEADAFKLHELKKAMEKAEAELTIDTDWVNAKNELEKALNAASAIYAEGKKTYTDETWNAFITAYQNAASKKNASVANSTAAALNELAIALNQARTSLKVSSPVSPVTSINKNGVRYVIKNAAKKTAVAEKGLNKKTLKKVVIPSAVTINGVSYKVTEIKAKAFQNFTRITSVTIGKNVTKIGNQSFSGCKKLKTLIFKGKKVPAFVSKPFKKTPSKMNVKLAKGMKSKDKRKMKTRLVKAGVNKKAKIK